MYNGGVADLDLIETRELLEALAKRFDHIIAVGLQVSGRTIDGTTKFWQGNPFTCAGLALSLLPELWMGERGNDEEEDA